MRDCGDCTKCCTWLSGEAHGYKFGNGKSCKFLCSSGCSIYEDRPSVCKTYYCAWSQELIDEKYKPNKCGFIISVEWENNKQFLKVIEIESGAINKNILDYLYYWCEKMNTYFKLAKSTKHGIIQE